jgi:hypothetical protein
MITFAPGTPGPLAGVRVLDLSRLVAGNMLSLYLADFGADVIKIERREGDDLRRWREGGHEIYWKVYGRNKRSVVLDLKSDEGLVRVCNYQTQALLLHPFPAGPPRFVSFPGYHRPMPPDLQSVRSVQCPAQPSSSLPRRGV